MQEFGLVQEDLLTIFHEIHERLERPVQGVALDRSNDIKAFVTILLLIKIHELSVRAFERESKTQTNPELSTLKAAADNAKIHLEKLNQLKDIFNSDTPCAADDFFTKELIPQLATAGLNIVSNGNNLVLKIAGNNIAGCLDEHCMIKIGYHFADNLEALERLNANEFLKDQYQLKEFFAQSEALKNGMVLSITSAQVGISINQLSEKVRPRQRIKFVQQAGAALSEMFDDLLANRLLWADPKAGNLIFKTPSAENPRRYYLTICDTKGLLKVEDVNQRNFFTDISLVPVGFEKSQLPGTAQDFNVFYYTQALGNMLFKFATGFNLENIPDVAGDTENWVKDQCIHLVRNLLVNNKIALQSHPNLIQWLNKPMIAEAVLSMLQNELPSQQWTLQLMLDELQKRYFHHQMDNNSLFQSKEGKELAAIIYGLAAPGSHPKDRLSRTEAIRLLSMIGQAPKQPTAKVKFFDKIARAITENLPVKKSVLVSSNSNAR